MDIDNALLADFAEVVSGKLYVMGGGWDSFRVAAVPASARIAVAAGFRIGWEETNQPAPVRIVIEDDDGKEIVRLDGQVNVGRPPGLPPGASQLSQLAANLVMPVRAAGGFRVVIRAGEDDAIRERTLPFRIIVTDRAQPA